MPTIVEYPAVLERMSALGLRSLYYNSGAFGLPAGASTSFIGWIGPDDPTIRPEALAAARRIAMPYEQTLARWATVAWQRLFPGAAWVMPKSNWAYELDFGSKNWMPAALGRMGIQPIELAHQTNAPAIQFTEDERDSFENFVLTLLQNLAGSDFAIGWPNHRVACTLHHHKQLWWITDEPQILMGLNQILQDNQPNQ